jgi:hypothetical protein
MEKERSYAEVNIPRLVCNRNAEAGMLSNLNHGERAQVHVCKERKW